MFETRRKTNLSEQAYNQIKDAICQGRIAPGDILSESRLAEDLGMSRTPVREALRSLASEGFLEIKNGVGAYVKPLSSKDMENLYEIRCLLEMQAIKTSIYRITDQEIDDMERRFQEVYDACERGSTPSTGSSLTWTGSCTSCWWTTVPTPISSPSWPATTPTCAAIWTCPPRR